MKEKAKKFWEEYGLYVEVIAFGIGTYALGCLLTNINANIELGKGLNRIVEVTPELTFGEFRKQVIEKTFDVSKYRV